jgi:hypothetical protein
MKKFFDLRIAHGLNSASEFFQHIGLICIQSHAGCARKDQKEVTQHLFYWPITRDCIFLISPITILHSHLEIHRRNFSIAKFSHFFPKFRIETYTAAIVSHIRVFHAHFWRFISLISRWKELKVFHKKFLMRKRSPFWNYSTWS